MSAQAQKNSTYHAGLLGNIYQALMVFLCGKGEAVVSAEGHHRKEWKYHVTRVTES